MSCLMRRMGCLQLKRWLSFLPAAFVVYILLHYIVYQPDLQETHTNFIGSSPHRIVKLSTNDLGIKASVDPHSEAIYPPDSSDVTLGQPSVSSKEAELEKEIRQFNELTSDLERKMSNQTDTISINKRSSLPESASASDITAQTTSGIVGDSTSPVESRAELRDNEAGSLFGHSGAMEEFVKQSLLIQKQEQQNASSLKAAENLKKMQERRQKEIAQFYPAKSRETSSENNIDQFSYVESILPSGNPHYEAYQSPIGDQFNSEGNSPEMVAPPNTDTKLNKDTDPVANPTDSSLEQKPNADQAYNYVETSPDLGPTSGQASLGQNLNAVYSSVDLNRGPSEISSPEIPEALTNEAKLEDQRIDAGASKDLEILSQQDSIIVPRELLSREDKDTKSKQEDSTTSVEEKSTGGNSSKTGPTGGHSSKPGPTGNASVAPSKDNVSEIAKSVPVLTQQLPVKIEPSGPPSNSSELLPLDSKSNTTSNVDTKPPSPPQPTVKSEPKPTSVAQPTRSKESTVKSSPPVKPATTVKAKPPVVHPKHSSNFAISALNGPITVGQKYEKGFATAHEDLCPNNGRDLKVLILITTAPDHEKHRNAVRQTWGHFSMRRDIVMAFVVGRTARTDVQTVIDKENDRYGDIIEANFVDHYSNLTLKTVSMFEWAKTYCSEARFILKTDDDMYINVPLLLAFITAKNKENRVMYGRLAKGWKPVRNQKSKYYIDVATYSRVRYPDFLTGPAYLFTNDVVEEIYQKSLNTTFFVLEDVLVTGIVGESLGVKRVGDSHFRNEKIKLTDTCKLMQSISIHMVKYEEQFDIYKRTLDGKTKCKTR